MSATHDSPPEPEPETATLRHPIVRGQGASVAGTPSVDPYERLEQIMTVVEELCLRWPARPNFTGSEDFRL